MTSHKGAIPRYSCNPSCETLGVIDAFLEGHGCCHGGQWDPKKIMRPDILKVHTRQSSSSKMINSSRRLCSLLQNPWRKQCGDHEFQAISSSISGVVFEEHMMRIGYDVINISKNCVWDDFCWYVGCLFQPFKITKNSTPQTAQAPQGTGCATESGQHGSTVWADGNAVWKLRPAGKWLQVGSPDLEEKNY